MTAFRRAASFAVCVTAIVVPFAAGSSADSPTATGWWWAGNIEGLPVQAPPPNVPEGGLYVAGGLSGASGVSALRFTVPDGASAPVLALRFASTSGAPVLGICPATTAWVPAAGGPWGARPTPDCDRASAPGELDASGEVVRFALDALVSAGAVDVVVLPGKDPATGIDATFEATFDRPATGSLTYIAPAGSPTPPAPPAPGGATATTAAPRPGVAVAPGPAPTPVPAPDAVAFAPAANAGTTPVDPDVVSSPPLPPMGTDPGETEGRVAGLVLIAAVAGAFVVLTRTGAGARLAALSGGDAGNVRGIGRYAPPRDTTDPPPL